jgi:hypothetical protein
MRLFLKLAWRLVPEFLQDKAAAAASSQAEEIRTKGGYARTKCVRICDLMEVVALFSLSPLFAGRGLG